MERLTKREGKHTVRIGNEWRRHDPVWDKLAYYEDLEEQGRLIIDGERRNLKLTLQDLYKLNNKFIWWDNFGGILCQCKNGYVVTEYGTFSFDFVSSNGSAYLHKTDINT